MKNLFIYTVNITRPDALQIYHQVKRSRKTSTRLNALIIQYCFSNKPFAPSRESMPNILNGRINFLKKTPSCAPGIYILHISKNGWIFCGIAENDIPTYKFPQHRYKFNWKKKLLCNRPLQYTNMTETWEVVLLTLHCVVWFWRGVVHSVAWDVE